MLFSSSPLQLDLVQIFKGWTPTISLVNLFQCFTNIIIKNLFSYIQCKSHLKDLTYY